MRPLNPAERRQVHILVKAEGDLEEGVAYYSTSNDRVMVIIGIEKMSSSEWDNFASFYEEGETNKLIKNQVTYYYIYEKLSGEDRCYIDTYREGKYYTIDVSILNSNEEECINTAFNVYESLNKENDKIIVENKNEKSICLIPFMLMGIISLLYINFRTII